MTSGPSSYLANKWLDMVGGTAFTAPAAAYAKLHTGNPGSAGTSSASANTTRVQVALWSSASGGVKQGLTVLEWSSWASGAETITHVTLWDAASSGNFLWSFALDAGRTVNNGDTLTISGLMLYMEPTH